MNDFSTTLESELAGQQSGWAEIYDIYLKSAIVTPWGTISILRLTSLPVGAEGFAFFKPQIAPEADADQGDPETYKHWPLKRELIKSDSKTANDKIQLHASNVTAEWAQMLANVDWYDTPIVIRKVPLTIGGAPIEAGDLTADDCAVIFSGQIDAAKITLKQLSFEISNDTAALNIVAPRENMHTNCRFRYGDDFCTQLKHKSTNYKSGTVGNSSTATLVKSSDFTEDSATNGNYGTDLVNPLSDAAITASSEGSTGSNNNWANEPVTCDPTTSLITLASHNFSLNDKIVFSATAMPTGLSAGTIYYVRPISDDTFYVRASAFSAVSSPIAFTTAGTDVLLTSDFTFKAAGVKSSKNGYWKFSNNNDWGDKSQGFYLIPDAQSGLANAALKPYIQFDFGSAKTPKLWRISSVSGLRLEELPRLLVFFSSTDASTWTHETYFELPARGGQLFEVNIPNASSARYWRICVRSRWAEGVFYTLLNKVYAYEASRNYWRNGYIKFASNTSTAALRNVTARVLESYSGEIVVQKLPAAPANGDTFSIGRGCARTFNACCERSNWENFGGFLDLPYQTVIR